MEEEATAEAPPERRMVATRTKRGRRGRCGSLCCVCVWSGLDGVRKASNGERVVDACSCWILVIRPVGL